MSDSSVNNIRTAWKQYISEGSFNKEVVRPIISESWIRSREYGIDPFLNKGIVVSNETLGNKLERNQRLLEISRPFMKSLYDCVAGSGFIVVLFDHEGVLLAIKGDKDVEKLSESANLIVGTDLSERSMGTNAPGTVLLVKKPLQIVDKEHYCTVFNKWTCSASPIFGVNGKLLGGLNISGNYKKTHSHTLGMVVAATKAIENELRLDHT